MGDEIEAAIDGVVDAVRHDAQARLHQRESAAFIAERRDKLRALIARRVAEAEARARGTIKVNHGDGEVSDSGWTPFQVEMYQRMTKERDEARAEVERLRAEPEPRASSGLVKAVRDYVDAEDEDRASEFNAMCTALRAAESTGGIA